MNKGVSLIALVITIIVIIVLAGITLGVFTKQYRIEWQDRKIEAIVDGTRIEVDYYYINSESGTAKIVSKDGTIYHTSNYSIIENGE